jgi:hypothetical protein
MICSRKKQHRSYAQAAKLAGKHGRREHDELTVYRCLFCGLFHLAHDVRNGGPEPAGLRERTARGLAKLKEMLGR